MIQGSYVDITNEKKINVCGGKNAHAKTGNISVSMSLPKVSNLSVEQVFCFLTKVEHTRLCVWFFFLGNLVTMDISVTFVVLNVTGQLWSVSAILLSGDARLRVH